MEQLTLKANARNKNGTRESRRARRRGQVPAILYGHGIDPVSLEVGEKDLIHLLHNPSGRNAVVSLDVPGVKLKESTCLIKDIQHHPVTDEINHVDFTVISMTEKIKVKVALVAQHVEEAIGVKDGGVLDVVHHEIEIECLPTNIPEKITVDVKQMKIGDALHMKEITLPEGVTSLFGPEEVMVALHPPRKEEEAPAEGEALTEPEVIEKGKKEEEGAEEGEAAPAPAPAEEKKEKKKE